MTLDTIRLRELATAAKNLSAANTDRHPARVAFDEAITPDVVIALLDLIQKKPATD
jgi:hypothetical protein